MKQFLINRAHRKIKQHLRARHDLIVPIAAQGLFNNKCFDNCVEWLRTHPNDKALQIVECVFIENGSPTLHYLVFDSQTKQYLEVTLGYRAEFLEYYPIRTIHPEDHKYIGGEFQRSLDYWVESYVGWFGRKVLKIERVT